MLVIGRRQRESFRVILGSRTLATIRVLRVQNADGDAIVRIGINAEPEVQILRDDAVQTSPRMET